MEFPAGVRRMKIKARRYNAGWSRLSGGGRKGGGSFGGRDPYGVPRVGGELGQPR